MPEIFVRNFGLLDLFARKLNDWYISLRNFFVRKCISRISVLTPLIVNLISDGSRSEESEMYFFPVLVTTVLVTAWRHAGYKSRCWLCGSPLSVQIRYAEVIPRLHRQVTLWKTSLRLFAAIYVENEYLNFQHWSIETADPQAEFKTPEGPNIGEARSYTRQA